MRAHTHEADREGKLSRYTQRKPLIYFPLWREFSSLDVQKVENKRKRIFMTNSENIEKICF